MGLCNFDNLKIVGMGLNEAAVQYVTSKIIGIEKDYVKYFGVSFRTISPSYYPLECNLIEQMAYITGESVLYDSTFTSNDKFKNTFIKLASEDAYDKIEYYIDQILELEGTIIKLGNKFSSFKTDWLISKSAALCRECLKGWMKVRMSIYLLAKW